MLVALHVDFFCLTRRIGYDRTVVQCQQPGLSNLLGRYVTTHHFAENKNIYTIICVVNVAPIYVIHMLDLVIHMLCFYSILFLWQSMYACYLKLWIRYKNPFLLWEDASCYHKVEQIYLLKSYLINELLIIMENCNYAIYIKMWVLFKNLFSWGW